MPLRHGDGSPPRRFARMQAGLRRRTALAVLAALCLVFGAFVLWDRSERDTASRARSPERAREASWIASVLARTHSGVEPSAYRGVVHTPDGKPVQGALVCASCASCTEATAPAPSCVRSAHDGGYALQSEMHDAVVIAASASGFGHGYANRGLPLIVEDGPRSGLDITLSQNGARLAGVVIDALGGPVADARVKVVRFSASVWSTLETRSDADGRFELWASAGHLKLRAEAEGYAPASRGLMAPAESVVLQLVPESSLRGRVVSASDGTPVAGVTVQPLAKGFMVPLVKSAISNEDGRFELKQLEPGAYHLRAESERWRGGSAGMVAVGLVDTVENVIVRVVPAVTAFGRVLIGAGEQPCPRGSVELTAVTTGATEPAATQRVPSLFESIEADGGVVLRGLTPGRYRAVVSCAEHLLDAGPSEIEVADADLELLWRVRPGLGLTVNVVDARARPVPFARVLLIEPTGQNGRVQDNVFELVSDAAGRVEVQRNFGPGSYRVEVSGGLRADPIAVELSLDRAPPAITLRVQGDGAVVARVRDAQGLGVSGLQLTAHAQAAPEPAAAHAAASAAQDGTAIAAHVPWEKRAVGVELGNGNYRIGPLAEGAYTVELRDALNPVRKLGDADRAGVIVRSGQDTELEVQLARSGRIRGRVVSELGQGEPYVWVRAGSAQDESSASLLARMSIPAARVMTDPEGEFTIEGLEPGLRYTLEAEQPTGSAATLPDVGEGQYVTLVLPAAATIAGEVAGADGRLAGGTMVRAHDPRTRTTRTAVVAPNGAFRIDNVPPGSVTVIAYDRDRFSVPQTVELRAGEALKGVRLTVAVPEPAPNGASEGQVSAQAPSTSAGEQRAGR